MSPHWSEPGFASPSDLAACRAMIRAGSRTFFAASKLLPRGVSEPAFALYAFCRVADDAIDLAGGRMDNLARLRERLARAYDGQPLPLAADRAFADVVVRFAIPRTLPEALLEGFEWDAAGRRYEDLADVFAYAARVAGSVGAMMALLMGARAPDVVARACDLGVAMQLSNIARDVGEDARAGRLYLPLRWLREAGLKPEVWLARPVFSEALGVVVRRLLKTADVLYERAGVGVAQLPLTCRSGIHTARLLYAEIGCELERRGLNSVSRRCVVPFPRKARLLTHALVATVLPARGAPAPPLDETRFLVEAVVGAPSRPSGPVASDRSRQSWGNLAARGIWLIDLFERLERLERREHIARPASDVSCRRIAPALRGGSW